MFIIGVAGGSGSGKTTFAKKVYKLAGIDRVSILAMDSYYLPSVPNSLITEKGHPNFDHPDAFDWRLLENHLKALKRGEIVKTPKYDFSNNRRVSSETIDLGPCNILIFEGIFSLFKKEIREILDIKCFLHVEADIRFTRRLHRDIQERGRNLDSVISQYYDTVRPMYQKFLSPQKDYADFIVGEETDAAARILAARVKELKEQSLAMEANTHDTRPNSTTNEQTNVQ
jgi:uridine kinase